VHNRAAKHQPTDADLVDSTHFEKSLRLIISFGSLKRGQFVSALEERLKPALDKVSCGGPLGVVSTAADVPAAWHN
jgi:hypothetical protein